MVKKFFIHAALLFGTLVQIYAQSQPAFSDEHPNKLKQERTIQNAPSLAKIRSCDIISEHDVNQNNLDKPNTIESNVPQPSISMYPNPVISLLQIELPESSKENYVLLVTDPAGRIILNQNLKESNTKIDMSQLRPSWYLLFVFQNGKLIKEGKILRI